MPAREYRSSLENLRIAFDRALVDAETAVRGWRQSAQVVSFSAEHAVRSAINAGFREASTTLARISEGAREATSLAGAEAFARLRALRERFDEIVRAAEETPSEGPRRRAVS